MNIGTEFQEIEGLDYIAVQKALSILCAFIPDNEPKGTMQLSKSLNLNKSTVSRLLQVLVYYELLEHNKVTKTFKLGRIWALDGMATDVSKTKV